MRAGERTRTCARRNTRRSSCSVLVASTPRKIGESRCPLSWLRGWERPASVLNTFHVRISSHLVRASLYFNPHYTDACRALGTNERDAIYLPFRFRWHCRRNAGGNSLRNVQGAPSSSVRREISPTCSENRKIDWWTCYKGRWEVSQPSTSCFTLTRRTHVGAAFSRFWIFSTAIHIKAAIMSLHDKYNCITNV